MESETKSDAISIIDWTTGEPAVVYVDQAALTRPTVRMQVWEVLALIDMCRDES